MASWGLAYEYGKNAYEDMWRKQEENDRYAAESKLYYKQLEEQAKELETSSREKARTRQLREIAVQYGDDMGAGGDTGIKAYANAMTAAGIPTVVVDDTKVVRINPETGKPDMSTAIDMSDREKWTGDAIKAEYGKTINTLRAESEIWQAQRERDREFKFKVDKFNTEESGKNYRARLAANTAIAAAGIRASGKGGSGSGSGSGIGSDGSKYFSTEKSEVAAADALIKSMFGSQANAYRDKDGVISYKMNDGTPITLTDGQAEDLNNSINEAVTNAANATRFYGTDQITNARNFGIQYGAERTDRVNATANMASYDYDFSYSLPSDPMMYSGYGDGNTASYFTQGLNLWNKQGIDGMSSVDPSTVYNPTVIDRAFNTRGTGLAIIPFLSSFNYN